nr:DUF4159 domain-containing protein [Rhizobium halophytocola]
MSLAFTTPFVLVALAALPLIWWLLKLTPPRPRQEVFPPLKILATILKREETPAKSPWWLTLLRILMAALVIVALADPVLDPRSNSVSGDGPLVLVIDNSWASAGDWERRRQTAEALIAEADGADVPVSIVFTAEDRQDATPSVAAAAEKKLVATGPRPLGANRPDAIQALKEALDGTRPGTLAFLTDGMARQGDDPDETISALQALSPRQFRIIEGDGNAAIALTSASNGADALAVTASRLTTADARTITVNAQDAQGRAIASGTITFPAGAATARGEIAAPFELRNDFARVSVAGLATAGSVHLLDDGFRRRRVALLAGDSNDEFQPLLSPLYYIDRALDPYADLIKPKESDLAVSIPELLTQNPSAIVMADIGRLPPDVYDPLQRWIGRGGTLIRFAGPRLAATPTGDPLVPVTLRQGERALGGALSWAEPQPLADFPANGPFAGMPRPTDVSVKRQVLAEPTPDLAERTWASLADGTPLVTARAIGRGRIVLFHVTAEATWSNLPISGDFVEMLRRLVQLSPATAAAGDSADPQAATSVAPWRLLTADGALTADAGSARPLDLGPAKPLAASFDNPPGLYGSEDGFTALNLLPDRAELKPLDLAGVSGISREPLIGAQATPLKPTLLALALALLFLDALIVLFMNGAFARIPRRAAATAGGMAIAAIFALSPAPPARADDSKPGDAQVLERLDNTHLAYVITGEDDVDTLSREGLEGLTEFLTYRTTLEPGEPVGVDISKDELSFYPILFWPVSASAPMPSAATVSRIDAYMRAGGTVLFDTRDQLSSLGNDGGPTPNGQRLQAILASIDIPPLEPVPSDHVLTRAFYLLSSFPGRYSGSPLWVEARQEAKSASGGVTSSADGVSPIMITGNDLLGAWAIDANGQPLMPTVPPDERQRELSYRAGVNIMMYMLTGNYKADQVHVPALLERLGQ